MNFNTEFAAGLNELLRLEPALARELGQAENTKQAVERFSEAAKHHDIALTEDELRNFLTFSAEQARISGVVHELAAADPALSDTLQEARHVDEAVAAVMAAARSRGLTLDAERLASHLEYVGTSNASGELADEALEEVTGGAGLMVGALAILASIGAIGGQVAGFVGLGLIFKKLRK